MKDKQNVGIDIDSTAFSTEEEMLNFMGLFYNETFHKRQIKNSFNDLNIDDYVIMDAIDLAVSNTKSKRNKYSKRTIQWLSNYYNIWFLTYRDTKFEKETIELLNVFDVDYSLFFNTRGKGKHDFINYKNIKILIEDDSETVMEVSKKTDCTVLIYDQPWNQDIVQDYNKIRVYDWKEVKDYFIIRGVE